MDQTISRREDAVSAEKLGYLKEAFRLFHLRDQGGPPVAFHYHDFPKLMLLLEGKVSYVVEGRSYHLTPGDLVLVGRGQIHRPEPDPAFPYERILLYLSPAFLAGCEAGQDSLDECFQTAAYRHSNVLRLMPEDRTDLRLLLKRLELSQQHQDTDFAGPLYSRVLCLEFLIALNRLCRSSGSHYLPNGALDYRVAGLISYINDHLSDALSIPVLSRVCCLSPYHMMRLFKAETGCTIGTYITEKRLLLARDLLAGGQTATQACFTSGFSNYSAFLRAYKKQFGSLPREYHPSN